MRSSLQLPDLAPTVRALHASPAMVSINVTGGLLGLGKRIWGVPGSSGTLIGFQAPYARSATIGLLGRDPGKFCTTETAVMLAEKAYAHALEVAEADKRLIAFTPTIFGFGGTVALATDRTKKGADRVHLAVRAAGTTWLFWGKFEPGLSRALQDDFCEVVALALLAHAVGLEPVRLPEGFSRVLISEHFRSSGLGIEVIDPAAHANPGAEQIEEVRIAELLKKPIFLPDGRRETACWLGAIGRKPAFLPGSFDPVHPGHFGIAEKVREGGKYEPIFVIEANHPDKGPVPYDKLMARVAQFAWKATVMVTSGDGLFIRKARTFPGLPFILGADTARRLLDGSYYGGKDQRDAMLSELESLGTTIMVVDRLTDGALLRLEDLSIPDRFRSLFTRVEFRMDISSTQIRRRGR